MHTRNEHPGVIVNAARTTGQAGCHLHCITHESGLAPNIAEWQALLAQGHSCEKIYQSPEFFQYLMESHCQGADRFELFLVEDDAGHLLGIVPVRFSSISLHFKIGSMVLYTHRVPVIRLLGSLPLLGHHDALRNTVICQLLDRFPGQAGVLMQAYPAREKNRLHGSPALKFFAIHGWRACHTIPLPCDFASYLQKISAKRRYNMAREIRLLQKELGTLCLTRIAGPADVPGLFACLDELSAASGGAHPNQIDYTIFASNNIALSYTLRAGDDVVGAILGSRYGDTWHVHRIHFAQKYRYLSAGSVTMHLAIEDIMRHFTFTHIDFGFGTPKHPFASTHVVKERATILASRTRRLSNMVLTMFVACDQLHNALARKFRVIWEAR